MLRKVISKRGYVFTYEAILIAFVFLSIFYIGYMVYSHNLLTGLEEKKDTEKFHKALLLKDLYLKKYEFPGRFYTNDYMENFTNKLNLQEKTFDPLNDFSECNRSFYFIIFPNIYDEMLENVSDDTNNFSLNKLSIQFDDDGKKINFTIYSNVTTKIVLPSINGTNIIYFKENVYIPKITGITKNKNKMKLYGCSGDHIYFKLDARVINASARIIAENGNPFISWQDWKYASPILIINNLNHQLPNYAVKIVFDSQSYVNSGEMRSDCGDVRFVDKYGNPLDYWIEPNTINTRHTVAWVKVNLPSNGHKLIYMLYGNPTATTTANGENTFEFFEDFSKNKLDNTKWNYNFENPLFVNDTYSNGLDFTYLSLDYNHYNNGEDDVHISTHNSYDANMPISYAVRFHANFHKKYEEWGGFYKNIGGNDYNREIITNYHWGGEWLRAESSRDDENHNSYIILQDPELYDHWHTYEIQRNRDISVNFIIDDIIHKTIYSNIYTGNLPVSFYARRYDDTTTYGYQPNDNEKNGNISIDWVFVRPYVEPEPTVAILSSDVIFTVNGYIYKKPLISVLKPIDITPNLKEGINEIRILRSPLPVEFLIKTDENTDFYYLTLSPKNITIVVKP